MLKWIGIVTAVISLILGARQIITIASDHLRRTRESTESIALARREGDRAEFAAAWKSLDRAESAERSAATEDARIDIGFRWLEDARPGPNQPFSSITDAVVPVLDRALLDPQHPRRADLLAHLGWATFLKQRDTGSGDPAVQYKAALAIDRTNVYANAMLGHWLLWQRQPSDVAKPYFDAALATGKEHALVRRLQLAALQNSRDEAADLELVRVANSMREQNETPDVRTVGAVYYAYVQRYGPNAAVPAAEISGISPRDRLATYTWLVRQPGISNRPEIVEFVRARLQQDSGDSDAALRTLRAILPSLGGASDSSLRGNVVREIARIERPGGR